MRRVHSPKKKRYFGKKRFTPKQTENKKFKNAKTHIYDGMKFRSGLEVFCYQKLKEANLDFEYEQRTFILQDGFTYSTPCLQSKNVKNKLSKKKNKLLVESETHKLRPITYTPDFVSISNKAGWIVETKGRIDDPTWSIKSKMFKLYLERNGYKVYLFLPSNHSEIISCIAKIKTLDGNPQKASKANN